MAGEAGGVLAGQEAFCMQGIAAEEQLQNASEMEEQEVTQILMAKRPGRKL